MCLPGQWAWLEYGDPSTHRGLEESACVSARVSGHGCVQLGVIDHRRWCSRILEVLSKWCRCREGLRWLPGAESSFPHKVECWRQGYK